MIRRPFAGLVLAGLFALGCGREPAAPPRAVPPPVSDRVAPPKKEPTIADSGKGETKEAQKPLDEESPRKSDSEPQPARPAEVEVKVPERPRRVGAMPPFERRLPATTRGFVSVPVVPEASGVWEKTTLAALWNDPAMKPFRADANARVDRGTAYARWTLGLTPEELSATVSGELAVAVLRGTEGPGLVVLADVGGATEKADSLVQTAVARLVRGGAKRSEQKASGAAAVVLELPPALQQGQLRQVVYVRKGDLLVAASTLATATAVLDRPQDGPGELGQREPFRTSTTVAENDLGSAYLRWFIEPLAFWRAVRELQGTTPKPDEQDRLRALERQGFEAIQGIGGAALLATATHEVTARTYVFAPPPYKLAMRMLVFPDVEASLPPAFVPAGAAGCLALSTDWVKSFDACGTLFDELFGDGQTGVFDEIVRGIRDIQDGPRVDVRRDVINRLERPLWMLSLRPGKDEPLSVLGAIPVTAEKAFAGVIRRLFENTAEVKALPFGEYGMFPVIPEQLKWEGAGQSALGGTVAVYQGHLLLAPQPNVLRAVAAKPEATLADSAALKDAWRQVEEQVGKKAFLRGMFRHEEMIRDSLQQLRKETKESDGVPARLLRGLLPSGPADDARAGMKLLPEMEKLKQPPHGTWVLAGVNREKGWLVLMQLPRPAGQ